MRVSGSESIVARSGGIWRYGVVLKSAIQIAEEKSLVEVHRRSANTVDCERIGVSWGSSGRRIGRLDD